MMRWAAALLLLIVLAVAALGVLLYRGTTLGPAQQLVETQLARVLERQLTLGQDPHIKLGRSLQLELRGAEIANVAWAGEQPLISARRIHVVIDTRSLFRAQVVVRSIEVDGLQVALARDEDGNDNLPDFDSDEGVPDEPLSEKPPLLVEALTLSDAVIEYRNLARERQAVLTIDTLTQRSASDTGAVTEGSGTLQSRPWTLTSRTTAQQLIALSQPFELELQATLPRLQLSAKARLPQLASLQDLTLELEADGQLPPAIAELSPLLTAETPLALRVFATDIDPGIALDATVALPNLQLHAQGDVHRPLAGDDLELAISASAPSLRPLAELLSLGETEDTPLFLEGTIARTGASIIGRDLVLTLGEHRLDASVFIPEFPRSDGAEIDLRGKGPEFAFYQRLLRRPASLPMPYEFTGALRALDGDVEVMTSDLRIGDHALTVEGPLGDFPEFRGSAVQFTLTGPDIDDLSEALGVSLPNIPYAASGELRVADDGRIESPGIEFSVAPLHGTASGGIDGYSEFDDLDIRLQLNTDSLRELATVLEMDRRPGAVPATVALRLSGEPAALRITELNAAAGEVRVASSSGGLEIRDGALNSDVVLRIDATKMNAALGDYGNAAVRDERIRATVTPRLDANMVDISVSDFDGPAARGSARLRIGRDFRIDERTEISAAIQIDNPAAMLPPTASYTPPDSPVSLSAVTRRAGDENRIEATLLAAADTRVALSARLPVGGEGPRHLEVRGSGGDLHALGNHAAMPGIALPFELDAQLSEVDDAIAIELRTLNVGDSQLRGSGEFRRAARQLRLDIDVPSADLDPWFAGSTDADTVADAPSAPPPDKRLIPQIPLPLAWMDDWDLDIDLHTGPLGISDPLAPARSLVDAADASLRSGSGKASFVLTELRGSRGSLAVDIDALRDGTGAGFTGKLALDDFPGGLRLVGGDIDALPHFAIDAELTASGSDTRQLAATLTGPLLITGGAGTLREVDLGFATSSFVDQLLTSLLPMVQRDQDLKVECTVLGARAENGVVALDPGFVLRSASVDLTARGSVDLRSEKIRIRFDNQARKGLGISAAGLVNPYVQITGTLGAPALALDVASGAIAGGAAAATGGLSVVATTLYGRFLRRNPCKTAMSRWEDKPG